MQLELWLALWHAPEIGPVSFHALLKQFPSLKDLFDAPEEELETLNLSSALKQYIQRPNWGCVEKDLLWAEKSHHHILTFNDPNYPSLLKEIATPPPILFVSGNLSLLNQSQLAIVGSRNPTRIGVENAFNFAHDCSRAGFVITSGLAIGIDGAAHKGALSGQGPTIGVLGTGIDVIYPLRHKKLAEEIIEQGALISEFPLGTAPHATLFPRRNRLISGLSQGVLVIEAAVGSGSLITANYANEQNREVFAIPGSIHNPLSRGCHRLIREGAKLVENVSDILEEFQGGLKQIISKAESPSTEHQTQEDRFLAALDDGPTPMETIILRTKLTPGEVSYLLLMLEMKGLVRVVPGGYEKLV